MAQHDYIISNQTFPNTRADINSVLQALATNNSGTSAPTTQYAGQFWLDTNTPSSTTWTLYIHDGTDDIQFAQIDTSANTVNFTDSALDLVTDLSPQLGGNLDLNSNDITGTGNINITGTVTATSFSGDGSSLTGISSIGGATGVDFNDNVKARFGTGNDLEIYHDGSNSNITDVGTGKLVLRTDGTGIDINKGSLENMAKFITDGAVELYYDNSKKLETTTSGINVTGEVQADSISMNDNETIYLGNSADLRLYHDGSNSYIDDAGTGRLYIRGNDRVQIQRYTGEDMITANADGSVNLYYDNSKKLETTTNGVTITGAITATGDVTAFYTSDKNLKENIKNIDNALDKVNQLNGVYYNWTEEAQKNNNHLGKEKEIGVIAQDVEKVLPEMVTTREDGTKAVRYERLCSILIEAVKELQEQIKDLKKGS